MLTLQEVNKFQSELFASSFGNQMNYVPFKVIIWIADNSVSYLEHNFYNGLFDNQTNAHDLNTRQVRYSDPQ